MREASNDASLLKSSILCVVYIHTGCIFHKARLASSPQFSVFYFSYSKKYIPDRHKREINLSPSTVLPAHTK